MKWLQLRVHKSGTAVSKNEFRRIPHVRCVSLAQGCPRYVFYNRGILFEEASNTLIDLQERTKEQSHSLVHALVPGRWLQRAQFLNASPCSITSDEIRNLDMSGLHLTLKTSHKIAAGWRMVKHLRIQCCYTSIHQSNSQTQSTAFKRTPNQNLGVAQTWTWGSVWDWRRTSAKTWRYSAHYRKWVQHEGMWSFDGIVDSIYLNAFHQS
jgi:hypothetical protein